MSTTHQALRAVRAQLVYFTHDPSRAYLDGSPGTVHHTDGLVAFENGRITAVGDYAKVAPTLPDGTPIDDLRDKVVTPGFIDTHIHYPQTDMIASPAPGLLPWLEKYTFPTERRFENPAYAADVAQFFLDELL
ncbi:MAG: amidohydrolase family protein, partial [Pandoraea sp.]|nr:amidohydrolase family protein [Pandoraea sp.]